MCSFQNVLNLRFKVFKDIDVYVWRGYRNWSDIANLESNRFLNKGTLQPLSNSLLLAQRRNIPLLVLQIIVVSKIDSGVVLGSSTYQALSYINKALGLLRQQDNEK